MPCRYVQFREEGIGSKWMSLPQVSDTNEALHVFVQVLCDDLMCSMTMQHTVVQGPRLRHSWYAIQLMCASSPLDCCVYLSPRYLHCILSRCAASGKLYHPAHRTAQAFLAVLRLSAGLIRSVLACRSPSRRLSYLMDYRCHYQSLLLGQSSPHRRCVAVWLEWHQQRQHHPPSKGEISKRSRVLQHGPASHG